MRRIVPLGIAVLMLSPILGLVAACAKDNAAIAKGGECFFATDCAPGLVCVPQKDKGTRICTDDLSGVAGEPPDMGEEQDASDEGGEGGTEGGMNDGQVVTDTGTDTGPVQDTGVDTGLPIDSGSD